MKLRLRGRALPLSPPTEGWKPGEMDLRRREVIAVEKSTKSQNWVQLAQVLSVLVALSSTLVALLSVRQSNEAAQSAAQASVQQTAENQLTSAVSSLNTGNSTVRTTQMLLIQRDINEIISLPLSTSEERADARSDYVTAIQALSVYISGYTAPPRTKSFGLGYGSLSIFHLAEDVTYALNTLTEIVAAGSVKGHLAPIPYEEVPPIINLSNRMLAGILWPSINIGSVIIFLSGSDLRGAVMQYTEWNAESNLSHSYLQCADLADADFRDADLAGADLRGANVQGADFRGANLTGAKLKSLYGVASWPQGTRESTLPVKEWNKAACLRDSNLWDNQPTKAGG